MSPTSPLALPTTWCETIDRPPSRIATQPAPRPPCAVLKLSLPAAAAVVGRPPPVERRGTRALAVEASRRHVPTALICTTRNRRDARGRTTRTGLGTDRDVG